MFNIYHNGLDLDVKSFNSVAFYKKMGLKTVSEKLFEADLLVVIRLITSGLIKIQIFSYSCF
jgi:hypothetical protein